MSLLSNISKSFKPILFPIFFICLVSEITLFFINSLSITSLSLLLPEGSPIMPVKPPITINGFNPYSVNILAKFNERKWPICIESAVGSIPM